MPKLAEWHIYGNGEQGRFAIKKLDQGDIYYLDPLHTDFVNKKFSRILSYKEYEIKDHLGNVRTAITDYKLPQNPDPTAQPRGVMPFTVDEKAVNDYYPYGMLIAERSWSSSDYRYGYNGKENDNEVKGTGNSIDYGARIFDPRVGRFLSLDPLRGIFPNESNYIYAGNTPISAIDKQGEYIYIITKNKDLYVALELINQTETGGNDLAQYINNPKRHLLISLAADDGNNFTYTEGTEQKQAAGFTLNDDAKENGKLTVGDDDVINISPESKAYKAMKQFNGIKKPDGEFSLIVLDDFYFKDNGSIPNNWLTNRFSYCDKRVNSVSHEINHDLIRAKSDKKDRHDEINPKADKIEGEVYNLEKIIKNSIESKYSTIKQEELPEKFIPLIPKSKKENND
jgi:RHS repeat-associated protein